MNRSQRKYLAEKLADAGNLAFGGLLLGQLLARQFDWIWTGVGGVIWVMFYGVGYLLLKGKEEQQ